MPSDPSGMQPPGTLVRPAPDFFDDSMSTGGAQYLTDPPVGNVYASISLFNNAMSGLLFKVYGITYGNDSTGGAFAYCRYGPPLGSLVGPCTSIRADAGTQNGQIWMRTDMVAFNALYPLPLPIGFSMLGAPGSGSNTILSPFPLFILPVGYSLVIANSDSGSQATVAFWYQQANE